MKHHTKVYLHSQDRDTKATNNSLTVYKAQDLYKSSDGYGFNLLNRYAN